jgi:hypothetical protein
VRIEALTLAVRPRLPFEAMDLGLRLVQSHWGAVYTAWAVAVVPVLCLATAAGYLLDASWLWSTLVWWLKPFYDRALVLVLSRAVFGEAMGAGDVARTLPGFFRTGLVWGLTWGRLDPSRSFTLPVWQLEGLRGAARRQRTALLRKGGRQRAMWLTTACIHLEMLLMFAGIALFFMVLPEGVGPSFDQFVFAWLETPAGEVLGNLSYLVALSLIEPLYVASGFTLYLNRRTELEGWDIEIAFRQLAARRASAREAA